MFNIGRQGMTNIVNESGVYSRIMTNRKPEAKDVAVVLGYERTADAIRTHCKGSVKHRLLQPVDLRL